MKLFSSWHYDWLTAWMLMRREWLKMFKEPSRLLGIVVQPLFLWWVIGSGFVSSFKQPGAEDQNYLVYFFPGVLAMVVLFAAIFSTISLIEDRASGLLQAVLVGPSRRYALVLGKVMGIVGIAVFQASLVLVCVPFAGLDTVSLNLVWLFLSMFLGALMLGLLGYAFAWWLDSSSAYHAVMSVVLIPMWIVSGAIFPLENSWLSFFSRYNPQAWFVEALRAAFRGDLAFGALLLLSALSLVLLCVNIALTNRHRA